MELATCNVTSTISFVHVFKCKDIQWKMKMIVKSVELRWAEKLNKQINKQLIFTDEMIPPPLKNILKQLTKHLSLYKNRKCWHAWVMTRPCNEDNICLKGRRTGLCDKPLCYRGQKSVQYSGILRPCQIVPQKEPHLHVCVRVQMTWWSACGCWKSGSSTRPSFRGECMAAV